MSGESYKRSANRVYLLAVVSILGAMLLAVTTSSCTESRAATQKKVIVLGFDGMDPKIVSRMMNDGEMPNFVRLAEKAGLRAPFAPEEIQLGTSKPPQSPVAWSNFITGMNSGGHGIADFVHRDPKTYRPFFSMAETREATNIIALGDLRLPLSGGGVELLRKGTPFWSYLTERGIPAWIIKIPVNFPPDDKSTKALSGMGTPDILGGYGEFTYYTTDYMEEYPNISGGKVVYVDLGEDNIVRSELIGPQNDFLAEKPRTVEDEYPNNVKVPFTAYLDEENPVAMIEIQGKNIFLREGEFSDWVQINFEMMPVLGGVSGTCLLYLKEVFPHFKLYVTAFNIDPTAPALPVSYPDSFSAEMVEEIGFYFTKGLPSDTKALDHHVLSDEEYVMQSRLILEERLRMFDNQWAAFKRSGGGLFFFYVSSTDEDMHMLWRAIDPEHPLHAGTSDETREYMYSVYREMDKVVGRVLDEMDPEATLLIMSDHGFASFAKEFNLNAWLKEKGYLVLKSGAEEKAEASRRDIDWSRTKAYGIGINGLYLNLKGREGEGCVEAAEAKEIIDRLVSELEAEVDPENGNRVIYRAYRREEIYSGSELEKLPDIVVGYNYGYRCSGSSGEGRVGKKILGLNPWMWSGDHCMAAEVVPGILFTSKPVKADGPSLLDLPVTILAEFGIDKPEQMLGRPIFD